MRLLIQEFLSGFCLDHTSEEAFAYLQEYCGIYTKRHPEFPELVQFAYDQIETSKSDLKNHPFVQECRGLILNESDNWAVVAFPFKRFFNAGEECAADIDWSNCRVQEKVDGSLMILYYYKDAWRVATKGSPDAGGNVGTSEIKFSKLFWDSAEYWLEGLCSSGALNPYFTYMVELTSPLNRVVCDYTELGSIDWITGDNKIEHDPTFIVDKTGYARDGSRLTLIGVRSNLERDNFCEYPVSLFKDDWHYVVKEFSLNSLDEVIAASKELNPIKQEGFVVVDKDFNRVKVKSPAYVMIHHIKDSFTVRRMLELIKLGEEPEVLSYYPEYQEQLADLNKSVDYLVSLVEEDYKRILDELGPEFTQKDFALKVKATRVPGALFAVRSGKAKSVRESILSMSADKLETLIRGRFMFGVEE